MDFGHPLAWISELDHLILPALGSKEEAEARGPSPEIHPDATGVEGVEGEEGTGEEGAREEDREAGLGCVEYSRTELSGFPRMSRDRQSQGEAYFGCSAPQLFTDAEWNR